MYCRSVFVLSCSTLSSVQNRKFPLFEPIFDECRNKAVFVLKGLKKPVTVRNFWVMKLTDADSKYLKSGQRINDSKSSKPLTGPEGSNPSFSATSSQATYRLRRLFYFCRLALISLRLLFPKKSYNFSGAPFLILGVHFVCRESLFLLIYASGCDRSPAMQAAGSSSAWESR